MDVEDVYSAAVVGLGELALSGCTTAFDHHYVVPDGDDSVFDVIVDAAKLVGIRIFLIRGSMDLGEQTVVFRQIIWLRSEIQYLLLPLYNLQSP